MKLKFFSEFLGTFQLVLIGTGSVLFVQNEQISYPQLWIGLAFGFAVFFGIVLFGKRSGAHMNPAVTLAFWLKGTTRTAEVPGYLTAQFLGATVASGTLFLVYPSNPHYGDTLPIIGTGESFALEFGLTAALMAGILFINAMKVSLWMDALFIGAIVGLEAYFAGPLCGASMNPARSFGPAVFSSLWFPLWIYLLAPVLGAVTIVAITRIKNLGQKR